MSMVSPDSWCPRIPDINWFRYIAGNNSGRFNIGTGAVINLYRWRLNEVIDPLHESLACGHVFVPWCHMHDLSVDEIEADYENFREQGSPPGFGRTDGDLVMPDFNPYLRPRPPFLKPSLKG